MESQTPIQKFPAIPVILSILVILLVAVGYLYYQNQQLKRMLAGYQFQPTNSPTPTGQTVDKSGWKKFISTKYSYSFEYPSDWEFNPYDEIKSVVGSHTLSSYDTTEIEKYMDHGIIDMQKYGKSIAKLDISVSDFTFPNTLENGDFKKYVINSKEYIDAILEVEANGNDSNDNEKPIVNFSKNVLFNNLDTYELKFSQSVTVFDYMKVYYVFSNNKVARIGIYFKGTNKEKFDDSLLNPVVETILKSFNFSLNDEQVACTMEAKLCPDGSSVGRSGPNCEFAPCP